MRARRLLSRARKQRAPALPLEALQIRVRQHNAAVARHVQCWFGCVGAFGAGLALETAGMYMTSFIFPLSVFAGFALRGLWYAFAPKRLVLDGALVEFTLPIPTQVPLASDPIRALVRHAEARL